MLKKWPTTHLCDWCGAEMFDEDTTSPADHWRAQVLLGSTRRENGAQWHNIVPFGTWEEVCRRCFIHFEKHAQAIAALTKGEPPA